MLLRVFAASMALALTTPAIPQTVGFDPALSPVDALARAKVPNEDGQVVDIIAGLNAYVNSHITEEADIDHYDIDDLWVMYPKDGLGDCEDFALTKLGMLGQMGMPVVSSTKLVNVMVHRMTPQGPDDEGHEILAVRLPHGAVLYLDNLNPEPMTREELVAQGYEFFDWKA